MKVLARNYSSNITVGTETVYKSDFILKSVDLAEWEHKLSTYGFIALRVQCAGSQPEIYMCKSFIPD